MTTHELKCWPTFFQAMLNGSKTFEIRFDGRDFHRGDVLHLREFVPGSDNINPYTGREMMFKVTFVLHQLEGLKKGWVAMGGVKL